jgi:D-alanine-D-alanine ligase
MGGLSGERKVSLKSGKAVAAALAQTGHDVVPWDVTEPSVAGLDRVRPDVVFVALHGPFGEDGHVQRMLESMGLPYTGSGPEASRLAMDKLASKALFVRHAIPTADYFAVGPAQSMGSITSRAHQFGCPLVCKPAASGSSLGVTIVRRPAALAAAVARARRESDMILIERYVPGRELTVGILDGEPLPLVELIPEREFFDYEAKYEDEKTRYVTPVSLLPTIYRKAREAALRAWAAIGCRHMARLDLIYGYDGRLYVLEANTIPGLTARSLLPMAAAEAGVSFPALCDTIARAALRDAAEESRRRRLTA